MEEQLALIRAIIDGLCNNTLYHTEHGDIACHYCDGQMAGSRDHHSFTHTKMCPVTLNSQLQRLVREQSGEFESGEFPE